MPPSPPRTFTNIIGGQSRGHSPGRSPASKEEGGSFFKPIEDLESLRAPMPAGVTRSDMLAAMHNFDFMVHLSPIIHKATQTNSPSAWLKEQGTTISRRTANASAPVYYNVAEQSPVGSWAPDMKFSAAFIRHPEGVIIASEAPLHTHVWSYYTVEEKDGKLWWVDSAKAEAVNVVMGATRNGYINAHTKSVALVGERILKERPQPS